VWMVWKKLCVVSNVFFGVGLFLLVDVLIFFLFVCFYN
jgi:hypothetical protein